MQISVDSSSFSLARTCAKPAGDRLLESTLSLNKKTSLTLRTFGKKLEEGNMSWVNVGQVLTQPELKSNSTTMPTFRVGKIRRKSCSLARRTKYQAIAAWRILYRLLFMVSVFMGQNMRMERQCVSIDHSIAFLLGRINLEILILVFERIDPHIKIAAGSIYLNIHGIIYIISLFI